MSEQHIHDLDTCGECALKSEQELVDALRRLIAYEKRARISFPNRQTAETYEVVITGYQEYIAKLRALLPQEASNAD